MITNDDYLKALEIVNKYNQQEKDLKKIKQDSCKHTNVASEVSEWHRNGEPDRYRTYCKDCDKIISD